MPLQTGALPCPQVQQPPAGVPQPLAPPPPAGVACAQMLLAPAGALRLTLAAPGGHPQCQKAAPCWYQPLPSPAGAAGLIGGMHQALTAALAALKPFLPLFPPALQSRSRWHVSCKSPTKGMEQRRPPQFSRKRVCLQRSHMATASHMRPVPPQPQVQAVTLTLRIGRCGSRGPRLPVRREAGLEEPGCLAIPPAGFPELAGWPAMAADAVCELGVARQLMNRCWQACCVAQEGCKLTRCRGLSRRRGQGTNLLSRLACCS